MSKITGKQRPRKVQPTAIKTQEIISWIGGWLATISVSLYLCKNIANPQLRLWLLLAISPFPLILIALFSYHRDAVKADLIKRGFTVLFLFQIICWSGAGYCWIKSATPTSKNSLTSAAIVSAPPAEISTVPASKASGVIAQTSVDAAPLVSKPASTLPQPVAQPKADDPYVVMLLPAGAADDIEMSADGFPVKPIILSGLELKVFVSPKTTTHFLLKCSLFGTREFEYFPHNNVGKIEPFAS